MNINPDSGSVAAQASKVRGNDAKVECPPGHVRIGLEKVRDGEVIETVEAIIPVSRLRPLNPSKPMKL